MIDLVTLRRSDGSKKLTVAEYTTDGFSIVAQPGVPPGSYMIVFTGLGRPLDNLYSQSLDLETALSRVEQLLDYSRDIGLRFTHPLTSNAKEFLKEILPVLD